MIRNTIIRALCVALCLSTSAVAQTAPAGQPAEATAAAAARLSGDPAALFSPDTIFYLEADDLASAFGSKEGVEAFADAIEQALGHLARPQAKSPVTADELQTLLRSKVAYGVMP